MRIKSTLILAFGLLFSLAVNASASEGDEKFNAGELVMHHIMDANEWHLMDGVTIPLPVILFDDENGLSVFLSSKFEHGHASYKGYAMKDGHIVSE